MIQVGNLLLRKAKACCRWLTTPHRTALHEPFAHP
jgi:hypothetical protein